MYNGSSVDYGCQVLQLNRLFASDAQVFLGDSEGFFILEVSLEQAVYVTSADLLSEAAVTAIVESGFDRGAGGRVKFLNLLQQSSTFSTVFSIELLDGLSPPGVFPLVPTYSPTSPPSAGVAPSITSIPTPAVNFPSTNTPSAPSTTIPPSSLYSAAPITTQSSIPSAAPSIQSTSLPSVTPNVQSTAAPSFAPRSPPSTAPISIPSDRPSRGPTVNPSMIPFLQLSHRPTMDVVVSPSKEFPSAGLMHSGRANTKGMLIVGFVAGVFLIVLACFIFFGVIYPLCGRGKDEESSMDSEERKNITDEGHKAGKILIPGMVSLDDNDSIANTSIGELTADGAFRIVVTHRLVGDDRIRMLDSFDDSLYTSSACLAQRPATNNKVSDQYIGPVDIDTLEEDTRELDESSSDGSNPYPFYGVRKMSSAMSFVEGMESRSEEEQSEEGRLTGKVTKGFDPFLEEPSAINASFSSGGFTTDENDNEGSSFDVVSVTESEPDETTHLTESSPSKQVTFSPEHLPTDASQKSFESDGSDTGEHCGESELGQSGDSEADDDPIEMVYVQEEYCETPPRPRKHVANNNLLRAVLEDARILASSKSPSSKSQLSRNSAPSRLPTRRSVEHSKGVPLRFLANKQEIEDVHSLASRDSRKGSSSVGGIPQGTSRGRRTVVSFNMDGVDGDRHSHISNLYGKSSRSTLGSFIRSSAITEYVQGNLGAQPLKAWPYLAEEKETAETPPSSPGVLGILEMQVGEGLLDNESYGSVGEPNRWLLGATSQAKVPRSPPAELAAGKSQESSRSICSDGSLEPHPLPRSYGRDLDGYLSKSPASRTSTLDALINGENNGSRTNSENFDMTAPRSLEQGLARLEVQLSDVQPESDHNTTSSLTPSSAGASRSSRASRIPARRSRRNCVVVVVPPGKLGIVLGNRQDGKGTFVSEVRDSSSMKGMLSPGDKLGELQCACSCSLLVVKLGLSHSFVQLPLMEKTSPTWLSVKLQRKWHHEQQMSDA
jgi:hypothetical protein